MDPHQYCVASIERLGRERRSRVVSLEEHQRVVILSFVAQQDLSAREFERQLRLLIEVSERSGRRLQAEAARHILRDWEAAAAGDEGAPPSA